MKPFLPARLLLVLSFLLSVSAYRLNVPRVLLPYHPNVPVSFALEVTHPTGGCFSWRSTRPDIVSVKSVDASDAGCSDKAVIRSVAKPGGLGTTELSAVIFAEDRGSGTTLSCGVTVDEIATISIETTTKVLFVDAAPARMTVDAFNTEGDRFSTLSEIGLEWELSSTSSNGEKPLRIVPFEQSTYEAPTEIVKLEKNRKKGYVILIEGVGTGTATLAAKFSDSYLQKVKVHSVELAVVANLLLVPSQDMFLPVQSVVPFEVLIVKQRGTEVVPMPSPVYHLQLEGNDVASLDAKTSSVRALVKGNTAVHLLSSHVDVRAKAGLRPPSTVIHVVDAESIQWHVSGENWMLETGKQYTINVELLDEHGNVMFVADNTRFETKIDKEVLRIDYASKNGTWFVVTPLKPAKTTLTSKFVAILDQNGKEIAQSGRVHGEQKATLVDPVHIVPPVVYLPFVSEKKSVIDLKATGGSGLFEWSVEDGHVAAVDRTTGKLTANGLGETTVKVVDKRNAMLKDNAKVLVIDVDGIQFGETARETFVGSDLRLNVQLFGAAHGATPVAISDCRSVPLRVEVADNSLLKLVRDAESIVPTEGTGCGTILLKGLSSGDTRVTVSYGTHKATIDVAVYEKLEISLDETSIALGSDYGLQLTGGPRPWILDSSAFYRTESSATKVKTNFDGDRVVLQCGGEEASETVKVTVGNYKSSTLPLPLKAEVSVNVCCARPTRLEIVEEEARPIKCPSNVHAILVKSEMRVVLKGHGVCAGNTRQLQSINGVEAKWSTTDSSLLKIEASGVKDGYVWAKLASKSTGGVSSVKVDVHSIRGARGAIPKALSAKMEVTVTEGLSMEPKNLVLWNEAVSTGKFSIKGGSGHFLVGDLPQAGPVMLTIRGRSLLVTPREHGQSTLRVTDACVNGQQAEASIRIADIHSLAIVAPQFVEIGQEVEVEIVAQDETGATFAKEHRPLKEALLEVNNAHATIRQIDGLRYMLRADAIGTVSLSATSKSSSGRVLASRPRVVQIFSPIHLQPKRLTLIPESTFQLEVIGGPLPTPPLDFALNNSKVATIEPNALITSRDLGYTSITGTVRVGDGHVTKDTVVLRVVSLAGVTLSSSARRVEAGGRVNLRLRGIVAGDRDEEPFAFGGALYPFKVTWSVSDPSVLQSVHPLGGDIVEPSENQFAIWFSALRTGSVTIKAHVEVHNRAKKHFVGSATSFSAEMTISVEDAMTLVEPRMALSSVRVAPNSQLQLQTAWSQVAFSIPNEYSQRVSITSAGLLRTTGREGAAAVAVRKLDSPDNETVLIPISISRVYSLDVHPTIELRSAIDKNNLLHLPVGVQIVLNIVSRDARGRQLAAASTRINYRPHRFDLTDIVPTNNNQTLTITLKSAGDTVLKISDASNDKVSTFVRLSASESLLPRDALKYANDLVVSDVVCLESSILAADEARWSSKSSSEGRVNWLDEKQGVGQLTRAGDTFLHLHADKQMIHSKISIAEPQALRFSSQPRFVTNEETASFVFAVTAVTNNTSARKLTSVYGDCSSAQKDSFASIRSPFDCFVTFVKKSNTISAVNWITGTAVFAKDIGYACEIKRFDTSLTSTSLTLSEEMEREQLNVQITAKWNHDSNRVTEAVATVPFHFSMIVVENELVFSNMDQLGAALSIWAPKYDTKHVKVHGCEGDIVAIEKLYAATDRHAGKANLFYNVKLNVKSAALFSEHTRKCRVVVENTHTGQIIKVPVTVQLLDETAKHVYRALESRGFIDLGLIFIQKHSNLIPTMLCTCAIAIFIIAVGIYVKRNVLDKKGSFNDTTLNNTSLHHTSMASSLQSSANGSSIFRDSPIFRSTPIAGSPQMGVLAPRERLRAAAAVGSSGDGRLWSTQENKRF